MLTKNELTALWKEHNFRPLKRFGQNFLVDKNVKDKILKSVDVSKDDVLIEIGAGFGEITVDLSKRAKKVFAIEKDKKIVNILKDSSILPANVVLVESDVLDVDFEKLLEKEKVVIYGNLPYYITSPIIEKLFCVVKNIKHIYLVVQKELADRIEANPGSRDIGRLSLFVQYYSNPKTLFKIGKNSFYPVPKVESAFIELEIPDKKKVDVKNEEIFFKVIKAAYEQRRKTILNSLSSLFKDKEKIKAVLQKAKIDPTLRAERLSLEDFSRLSNILHSF